MEAILEALKSVQVGVSFKLDGMQDDIIKLAEEWQFSGFDPAYTLNLLKQRFAKAALNNPEWAKEPQMRFKRHMINLCLLYVVRGTKIESIKKRTNTDALASLTTLLSTYVIVETKKSGSLGKDDVTLSRVAALFPVICVRINSLPGITRYVGKTSPKDLKIPVAYCLTVGAAVIPGEKFSDWLAWAYEYDEVVNEKGDKDKVKRFSEIAVKNSKIPPSAKSELFREIQEQNERTLSSIGTLVSRGEGEPKVGGKMMEL